MKHLLLSRNKTQRSQKGAASGNLLSLSFLCHFEFFAAIQNEAPTL
ncbi:MAG: hypothetical protein WAW39_11375 [Prosthecobacter sp.]